MISPNQMGRHFVAFPCSELHWTASRLRENSLRGVVNKALLFRVVQYTYTGRLILSHEEISQHPQSIEE